jgi:adenosylmethionine-8-amino-7-oxononanoate aminotransferase
MTGLGRTGSMLACEHACIEPEFLCLGKGLTAGWLPFSAVLTTQPLFEMFYDDYASGKSFLHSHTFSGHVLGAAVALEVLAVLRGEELCQRGVLLRPLGDTLYWLLPLNAPLAIVDELVEKTVKAVRAVCGW